MNDSIFRKKSLDRISSPEDLTDYIRVSRSSIWIVLSAIVFLLVSVLIWSVFGALPTILTVFAYVQDGTAICYMDSDTVAELKSGMTVQLGKTVGIVSEISTVPISRAELSEKYDDDYIAESLTAGDWNYPVKANISGVSDGLFKMEITIDSIKPISFVLN